MLPAISNLSKPAGQLIGLKTCMQSTGEAPSKPIHVHACRYMSCVSLCLRGEPAGEPAAAQVRPQVECHCAHHSLCVHKDIYKYMFASTIILACGNTVTVLFGHSLITTYSLGAGLHHDLFETAKPSNLALPLELLVLCTWST